MEADGIASNPGGRPASLHSPRRRSRNALALLAIAILALGGALSTGRLHLSQPAQAMPLWAGWNLIADPGGIVTTSPAYTLQQTDQNYETLAPGQPMAAGLGYWVPSNTYAGLPLGAGQPKATINAPAGQFVMVGDPSGIFPASVSGADELWGYDPRNQWIQLDPTILFPGQGAFAKSYDGGQILLTGVGSNGATCSTADSGSACPVAGACPAGYPVAVTNDALAHRAVGQTDAPVGGPIAVCFNDISQALAAGYQAAPLPRIVITGPVTASASGISVTVMQATLETPAAYMARLANSGLQLCGGCDVAGATAVVTVEYGLSNIGRAPTYVSTGYFVSEHRPTDQSPSFYLSSDEFEVDPVHDGSPTGGTVSGVLAHVPFSLIDQVEWRLDTPLIDNNPFIPQPHGPSLAFELDFRGPEGGQVLAYGQGDAPNRANPIGAPLPYPTVPPAATATAVPAGGAAAPVPTVGVPLPVIPVATPIPAGGSLPANPALNLPNPAATFGSMPYTP